MRNIGGGWGDLSVLNGYLEAGFALLAAGTPADHERLKQAARSAGLRFFELLALMGEPETGERLLFLPEPPDYPQDDFLLIAASLTAQFDQQALILRGSGAADPVTVLDRRLVTLGSFPTLIPEAIGQWAACRHGNRAAGYRLYQRRIPTNYINALAMRHAGHIC